MDNIKCINKKVAVEIIATDSKRGGLWIPENAKEKRGRGKVVSVGDKCELGLKLGDTVILPKFGGVDIEVDGKPVAILDEQEILGICDGKEAA